VLCAAKTLRQQLSKRASVPRCLAAAGRVNFYNTDLKRLKAETNTHRDLGITCGQPIRKSNKFETSPPTLLPRLALFGTLTL
jgi:hypothetical protein